MASYVYIMFRPEDGTPFYVGKGTGRRWEDHIRKPDKQGNRAKAAIVKRSLAAGLEIPVVLVAEGLGHEAALELEAQFIAAIGRKPRGPLVNLTDGGEGFRGLTRTPKHRAKIGAAHRGKKIPDALLPKYEEYLVLARAAAKNVTPERRSEAALKGLAKKPAEDRSAWQRKAWQNRVANNPGAVDRMKALGRDYASAEKQRKAVAAAAARSPEARSEATRKANASRSPEQRSLSTKKAWETRRARKAMSNGSTCLHD